MVVVKLEMWPKGDEKKAYSLGSLSIALQGQDARGLRRYEWLMTKFKGKGVWKRGAIDGHNPKTRGPWDLLYRILHQAVGSRNVTTSEAAVDPTE